jgi:branched-chain amino acid transport system substrate-binding protein
VPGPGDPKSEIVFGSFGIENGVLAAVTGPVAPAIRAWVGDVNARGGLNGHPVRVVMSDSGGDPARSQAIARQMVEKDKVVALINPYTIGELDPVMPYLEGKDIPVIGQLGGDAKADYSVMMFNPLQGADKGLGWELVFDVVKQSDKRKAAILYCREATICQNQRERVADILPYDGLELVYEAQVSLAQPDYTAEALGAKRAGADVVLLFMDINSIARFGKSAGRQGYKPVLATAHQVAIDYALPYADDLDGMLLGGRVPPYDGPALADYRKAIAKYQPKAVKGDMGAGAWVVGKLLERIAPAFDADPSSPEIIDALYGLKTETLGGLLPGVTFPRDKDRSNVNLCAIPTRFTGGKFVPHDAAASFVCAPDYRP